MNQGIVGSLALFVLCSSLVNASDMPDVDSFVGDWTGRLVIGSAPVTIERLKIRKQQSCPHCKLHYLTLVFQLEDKERELQISEHMRPGEFVACPKNQMVVNLGQTCTTQWWESEKYFLLAGTGNELQWHYINQTALARDDKGTLTYNEDLASVSGSVTAKGGEVSFELRRLEETFLSGGEKLAFRDFGNGPAVVLIHGLTGKKDDWQSLSAELVNRGYRAISVDVRGHGRSAKPLAEDAYGLELVHDVRRLLDYLKIKSTHIVGYSMGGDIVNKFREVYPTRTRSCVVGGAGLGTTVGWADVPHDFSRLADSMSKGGGFEYLLRLPGAIGPGIASDEKVSKFNNRWKKGSDLNALSQLLRRYPELELSNADLNSNEIPTLIVVGERDPECKSAMELDRRLGASRLQILKGMNHFQAQGKEFNKAACDFVDSTERAFGR